MVESLGEFAGRLSELMGLMFLLGRVESKNPHWTSSQTCLNVDTEGQHANVAGSHFTDHCCHRCQFQCPGCLPQLLNGATSPLS